MCDERERLLDYVYDACDADERRWMETHLAACADCREEVSGLRAVPPDIREAAIGMGYGPGQLLWRVELPLALAIIVAGVRVAAVTTIGLTTVTALIGQGGLGFFILDGIQRFFTTPLIVGATLSVALGVAADAALVLVQRWATPWARAGG